MTYQVVFYFEAESDEHAREIASDGSYRYEGCRFLLKIEEDGSTERVEDDDEATA